MFIIQSCIYEFMCDVMWCDVYIHNTYIFIPHSHNLSTKCVENTHLIGVESYACWQILWALQWWNTLTHNAMTLHKKFQQRLTFLGFVFPGLFVCFTVVCSLNIRNHKTHILLVKMWIRNYALHLETNIQQTIREVEREKEKNEEENRFNISILYVINSGFL